MKTPDTRQHSRIPGALKNTARAALKAADAAGDNGVPMEVLIKAQQAVEPDRERGTALSMVHSLAARGLMRYTANARPSARANWVLTPSGRAALQAVETATPMRPTDEAIVAILEVAEAAGKPGVPREQLIDLQLRLQPDRSQNAAAVMICALSARGLLARTGHREFLYTVTQAGLAAYADLKARLLARPQPELTVPPASSRDREDGARELYVPPNSRQITYDGRTVYVPRVRSVFDLGEALLLADAAASNAHPRAPA